VQFISKWLGANKKRDQLSLFYQPTFFTDQIIFPIKILSATINNAIENKKSKRNTMRLIIKHQLNNSLVSKGYYSLIRRPAPRLTMFWYVLTAVPLFIGDNEKLIFGFRSNEMRSLIR
jgi:hypothetical protein